MAKILCVIGTRPEAIKMAPVIVALRREPWVRVRVLATAQHREMLDQALSLFGIVPDADLNIMQPDQSLADLTGRLLGALDGVLEAERPDWVLAQGDTTSVLAVGLACFYRQIPLGHVEAGLRTGDFANPFPEEMNRVFAGRLARAHFAPTERARLNLLAEAVPSEAIFVTGNTVIDALLSIANRDIPIDFDIPSDKRVVLLTAHRRESFGAPLESIFRAVLTLIGRYRDLHFVYPVHLNPNVLRPAYTLLSKRTGITLCPPLSYSNLVGLMKRTFLVMTDSGGLQEEAPALGKPVLILREETERPEAVDAGVARIVGHDHDAIVRAVSGLLEDEDAYRAMAKGISPYGDGQAAGRIVDVLRRALL